jgi:Amt family ammonium transporter
MLGHSIPLATMGFLLMWLGLLGVMCAGVVQQYLVADANRAKSQLTRVLANDLGAAALNMMTCAAFAYVAAPGVAWMVRGDRITLVAGGLAWVTGCIASCCGTKYMTPWASAVLGLVAGALYVPVSALLVRCRIDDPITAVTVHTVGGFVGAVGVGLLAHRNGEEGAVYGGWRQLGVQVGGAVSIAAWALVVSGVFWGCMRWLRMARVSEDAELQGADEHLFCEPAYPENYAMADYLMACHCTPPQHTHTHTFLHGLSTASRCLPPAVQAVCRDPLARGDRRRPARGTARNNVMWPNTRLGARVFEATCFQHYSCFILFPAGAGH